MKVEQYVWYSLLFAFDWRKLLMTLYFVGLRKPVATVYKIRIMLWSPLLYCLINNNAGIIIEYLNIKRKIPKLQWAMHECNINIWWNDRCTTHLRKLEVHQHRLCHEKLGKSQNEGWTMIRYISSKLCAIFEWWFVKMDVRASFRAQEGPLGFLTAVILASAIRLKLLYWYAKGRQWDLED